MSGPLGGVPPAELLMTVARQDRGGALVLAIRGEVDLSTGGRLAEAAGEVLREAGGRPVVLDMLGVEFLSSSGLGVLVSLNDEARSIGTPLRVVVDQDRPVMRPIRTMGLDDVLSIFGTVDEALAG
ncbi:STAS domain-containing protein [Pseudonocardia lacus]|uniref:STAS domain-containing protein n=1 Tax=Pseudonocardia lacus TaxID=2835865 RepID=UPI001BDC653B|nr:STAS domain-containing protein [Pseudonocardia lacus]